MIARRLFIPTEVDITQLIPVTDAQGAALASLKDDIVDAIKAAFTSERSDNTLVNEMADTLDNGTFTITTENGVVVLSSAEINWNFTEYNTDTDGLGYLYALGIIRSRLNEDGGWYYSNTILKLNKPTAHEETNFGLPWLAAIPAWFQGSTVASDGEYLQAGLDTNVIGESFT